MQRQLVRVNTITEGVEFTINGDTNLRYDVASGKFIYTWKIPKTAGEYYRVMLILMDGSSLGANFKGGRSLFKHTNTNGSPVINGKTKIESTN